MTGIPINRRNRDTQIDTHKGKMPCEDWSYAPEAKKLQEVRRHT